MANKYVYLLEEHVVVHNVIYDVMFFFSELKPEKLAETIVKTKILEGDAGSQGCK